MPTRRALAPRGAVAVLALALCLLPTRGDASLIKVADHLDDAGPIVGIPLVIGAYLGVVAGVPLSLVSGIACLPIHPIYDASRDQHYDTFDTCYWYGAGVALETMAAGAIMFGAPFYPVAKAVGTQHAADSRARVGFRSMRTARRDEASTQRRPAGLGSVRAHCDRPGAAGCSRGAESAAATQP